MRHHPLRPFKRHRLYRGKWIIWFAFAVTGIAYFVHYPLSGQFIQTDSCIPPLTPSLPSASRYPLIRWRSFQFTKLVSQLQTTIDRNERRRATKAAILMSVECTSLAQCGLCTVDC